jgi:hypothetical protein
MLELTAHVAHENYHAETNRPLRVESDRRRQAELVLLFLAKRASLWQKRGMPPTARPSVGGFPKCYLVEKAHKAFGKRKTVRSSSKALEDGI